MLFILTHHGFVIVAFKLAIKYFLNFSVIISKIVNANRYNLYKQKFSGIPNKSIKGSWLHQKVWEALVYLNLAYVSICRMNGRGWGGLEKGYIRAQSGDDAGVADSRWVGFSDTIRGCWAEKNYLDFSSFA